MNPNPSKQPRKRQQWLRGHGAFTIKVVVIIATSVIAADAESPWLNLVLPTVVSIGLEAANDHSGKRLEEELERLKGE